MSNLSKPDLTQHPPRSPRVTLGGYAHLPRLIDKARAKIAGKQGEYLYDCAMDKHFFRFTGIKAKAFLGAVRTKKSDTEVLAWVRARTRRLPSEIAAWSAWLEKNGPGATMGHGWFRECIEGCAKDRDDIRTFFELLDLDDYVSFCGKG